MTAESHWRFSASYAVCVPTRGPYNPENAVSPPRRRALELAKELGLEPSFSQQGRRTSRAPFPPCDRSPDGLVVLNEAGAMVHAKIFGCSFTPERGLPSPAFGQVGVHAAVSSPTVLNRSGDGGDGDQYVVKIFKGANPASCPSSSLLGSNGSSI